MAGKAGTKRAETYLYLFFSDEAFACVQLAEYGQRVSSFPHITSMWSKGMDACVVFLTSLLQSTVLLMFKKNVLYCLLKIRTSFQETLASWKVFSRKKFTDCIFSRAVSAGEKITDHKTARTSRGTKKTYILLLKFAIWRGQFEMVRHLH